MNPSTKPLMWWALLGAVLISTGLALGNELAKRRAVANYQQARALLSQVQQQRDQLSQQLDGARQSLQEQTGRLAQLQTDLSQAEQEVSRLQSDYARLQQTNTTLAEQLAATVQTKAALEAKLSSVKSLKLAIRDLRRTQWRAFWEPRWQRPLSSGRSSPRVLLSWTMPRSRATPRWWRARRSKPRRPAPRWRCTRARGWFWPRLPRGRSTATI